MPRVTAEYRKQRRSEIAAAAARCIARLGMGTTTMGDIIAESGVSAGAVYGHFASKDEIIVYAAEQLLTERQAALDRLDHQATQDEDDGYLIAPSELMARVLSAGVRSGFQTPFSVQVMSHGFVNEEVAAVSRKLTDASERVFFSHVYRYARSTGQSHDDASDLGRELVPVMLALLQGFAFQVGMDPTTDANRLIERISAVLEKAGETTGACQLPERVDL